MSGVKRYMHISPLCEAAPLLMANYPMATEYVLASDYDRDTQALREDRDSQQRAGIDVMAERDALRAQVEVMRAALRGLRSALWLSCDDLPGEFEARDSVANADAALQAKP